MNRIFASILFAASSIAWSMTPQLSGSMRYKNDMVQPDCQGYTCKQVPWDSVCNAQNVIFDANDDGSFDIVFLNFKAETDSYYQRAVAQCHLDIPISVPDGYRLTLKSVAVAGITEVSEKGLSEASITHTFKSGRESIKTERFRFQDQLQDVVVEHSLESDYSKCAQDREVTVGTKVELVAQRQKQDALNTFIAIDDGAAQRKLVYRMDYQRCDGQPEPKTCGADSIEFNGKCRPLGKQCSDYDRTNVQVCNNGKDSLQCDFVPATQRCVAQCPQGHFAMDGQCFKIASQCSEYNGTSNKVCNNGHDSLQCDWKEQNRTCFKS